MLFSTECRNYNTTITPVDLVVIALYQTQFRHTRYEPTDVGTLERGMLRQIGDATTASLA